LGLIEVGKQARAILAGFGVEGFYFEPGAVGEGVCGLEVRAVGPVALKDVPFVRGFVFVVATVGPGAGPVGGVFACGCESALGDAKVEV